MNNRGNNRLPGVIIAMAILAVMAVSAFAGYRIITRYEIVDGQFKAATQKAREKTSEALGINVTRLLDREQDDTNTVDTGDVTSVDKEKISYTYRMQGTRNYDGPVILQAAGYIYNSEGKVLRDFYKEDNYYPSLTMDIDRKSATFIYEGTLYLLDAELNMTKVSEDVKKAQMCYDGSHCCYIIEDGTDYKLYIHDNNSGEDVFIDDSVLYATSSPNGKTVAYYTMKTPGYIQKVSGIETEEKVISDDVGAHPIAVSDDGNTVFYSGFSGNEGVFCYHDGEKIKLARKGILEAYVDRDVTQLLFEDDSKLKYYNTDLGRVRDITDNNLVRARISGVSYQYVGSNDQYIMIDSTCFSDVMTFYDVDRAFGLAGDYPEEIMLAEDARSIITGVTKDGPGVIYSNGNKLIKAIFNGRERTEKIIFEGQYGASSFAASEDLSEIWVSSDIDNAIIYIKDDLEPVHVTEQGKGHTYYMQYNPYDGMCYYLYDKNLFKVGDDISTTKVVYHGVDYMFSSYERNTYIKFKDLEKNEFVVAGGEILPIIR